jgi:hypothetical protein
MNSVQERDTFRTPEDGYIGELEVGEVSRHQVTVLEPRQ